jgi:hypothetical protein
MKDSSQIQSQWERLWRAAETVKDCVAASLIASGLHDAHAYIAETRISCPEPSVFTIIAIAGATHASIRVKASLMERNTDEARLFALLVAQCLYQRLAPLSKSATLCLSREYPSKS